MTTVNIKFGTEDINIILETFDINYGTKASEDSKRIAADCLVKMLEDPRFGHKGRRNDDAVNSMICLKVLGFEPVDYLTHLVDVAGLDDSAEFIEHMDRIDPYLEEWASPTVNNALAFMV